jgi:small-conductance mechanosensitive channel
VPGALTYLIAATTGPTPSPSPSPSGSPSPSPSPSPTDGGIPGLGDLARTIQDATSTPAQPPCDRNDLSVCGLALRATGDERLAQILGFVLGTPLRIALLVLGALFVRMILHRLIHRLADRISAGGSAGPFGGRNGQDGQGSQSGVAAAVLGASPLLTSRREQRARTLASVLQSITTGVVGLVLALMILSELGFQVAPLLASAGVVGVALGFGAQTLVRDFISGIFMILEDQYGVGDVVDLGEASGSVEAVGLRVTRIRDVNGTVWYVRNGEILRVGNQSQGWSRAVLDVAVGYDEDIAHVQDTLLTVAHGLREDPEFAPLVLDEPEVWGVEALRQDGVVVRLVVKTQPLQQWAVARELRRRIKNSFDSAGIELPPMPKSSIVVEDGDEPFPQPRSSRRAEEPEPELPAAGPGE